MNLGSLAESAFVGGIDHFNNMRAGRNPELLLASEAHAGHFHVINRHDPYGRDCLEDGDLPICVRWFVVTGGATKNEQE